MKRNDDKYAFHNIFSIMKGIAIVSVVIGHCSPAVVEGFVNQYHLATFYFLSGYFFKDNYFAAPLLFVKKRLKRLYLPFITYGMIFLMLHNLFCYIHFYPSENTYSYGDFGKQLFNLFAKISSYEPFMGAMWFLPSLLIISFLFLGIGKVSNMFPNRFVKISLLGVILSCSIGYFAIEIGLPNPWCIWSSMIVVALFYAGYVFKEGDFFARYMNGKIEILALLVVLIVTRLGLKVRLQPALVGNSNPLLFILVTLAGVIMVYGLARFILHSRLGHIMAILGDYSFEIMALHFISFKLVGLLHVSLTKSGTGHLSDFPVFDHDLWMWMPLYIVVGCALPVIMKKIAERLWTKTKYK